MTDSQVQPIRVLLIDDDPLVCSGLELILSRSDDIQIVGTAGDGDEAVAAVHQHFPDVVLLDVRMARLDGIAATKALRALANPPRVIVMTTFDADDIVMRAIGAGAAGFARRAWSATEFGWPLLPHGTLLGERQPRTLETQSTHGTLYGRPADGWRTGSQ